MTSTDNGQVENGLGSAASDAPLRPHTSCPVPNTSTLTHAVLCSNIGDPAVVKQPGNVVSSSMSDTAPDFPDTSNDVGQYVVALPHSQAERWATIERALRPPAANISTCAELVAAMRRYNGAWALQDTSTLRRYVADRLDAAQRRRLFERVLPNMIELALSLPAKFPQPVVPRLVGQRQASVTMSQDQAACLLTCGFFCMFAGVRRGFVDERQQRGAPNSDDGRSSSIDFVGLFRTSRRRRQAAKVDKLACLMRYFDRATSRSLAADSVGAITYHRRVMNDFPDWAESSDVELGGLRVTSDGRIEDDGLGMLQVDFANARVGGGVLAGGCVQEEIRFTICPELIVARLLAAADRMADNECVVVVGAEQYCRYVGYGDGFRYASDHVDRTPRDRFGRRSTEVVAIDAIPFYDDDNDGGSQLQQFAPDCIRRELDKAYCGFCVDSDADRAAGRPGAVGTGNWGCGAFGGDRHLKALVQMMAAAAAGRDVRYFTFGDYDLRRDVDAFHRFAVDRHVTVRDLWRLAVSYGERRTATTENRRREIGNVLSYVVDNYDHLAVTDHVARHSGDVVVVVGGTSGAGHVSKRRTCELL